MRNETLRDHPIISEDKRIEVTGLLQDRLEDSTDLLMQARQAHLLNTEERGTKLLANVCSDAGAYVDHIAGRIDQLEGYSPGTIRYAAEKSGLNDYPLESNNRFNEMADLAYAFACYSELIREAVARSNELEDMETAALFESISRGVDRNLWYTSRRTNLNEGGRKTHGQPWLLEHKVRKLHKTC